MFDQEIQQRKDLRLDRNRAALSPEFDPGRIQFKIFEKVDHRLNL
jgi:hypothetical protein